MPIDLAALASRFADAFAAQLKGVIVAHRFVREALHRRRDAARLVDRATESFPIVRFHNGAVTMVLAPGQRGSLTSALPEVSLREHLARGGQDFVAGLARAVEPLRGDSQETAIARFLGGAQQALAEVESSVRRFAVPGAGMFDPTPGKDGSRTASDLFGLAALGFRVLAEASTTSGEVKRLVEQVSGTLGILGVSSNGTSALGQPQSAPVEPAVRSMAETLDAMAYEALGAVVIIGSLPSLIDTMLTGMALQLKLWVLHELAAIERYVLDLRATVFETVFGGLVGLAERGLLLAGGAYRVIGANVAFQLRFLRVFGTRLAVGVREFVVGLGGFLVDVATLLGAIPGLLQAITGFELTSLVWSKLGWLTGHTVHITLDNLLDSGGHAVNTLLQKELNVLLDGGEKILDRLDKPPVRWVLRDKIAHGRRQLTRARWLVRELFGGSGGKVVPTLAEAAPLRFHSDFPDLGDTVFGGGRRAAILADVTRLEHAVRRGVAAALTSTSRGFEDLATGLAADATRSATVDVGGRLAGQAGQADRLADVVFGPEVAEQRRGVAERPTDVVAAAVEAWLATGGILAVGEAIPCYVGEMAEHWRAQLAEGTELTAELTPTSKHILRRRATLGRVALPRLTLRAAPGRQLDEEFADVVASRFAQAVRDAYRTGQRRLRELAEIGGT